MENYQLKFSVRGLVAFALSMIPTIIWGLWPPRNDILGFNQSNSLLLDSLQSLSQILMIALLVGVVHRGKQKVSLRKTTFLIGTICLISYYFIWVLYYLDKIEPWGLLALAVLPTLYFLCLAYGLKNYLMIVPCLLFGTIHIATAYLNFCL